MEMLQGNASDILKGWVDGKYSLFYTLEERTFFVDKGRGTYDIFILPEEVNYYLSIIEDYEAYEREKTEAVSAETETH